MHDKIEAGLKKAGFREIWFLLQDIQIYAVVEADGLGACSAISEGESY